MDYEKKYKELVAKIKNAHLYAQTDSTKNVLEGILPELAESEDERIRKEIIETFKILGDGKIPVDINYADIFTWLEKQGEQKVPIIDFKAKNWYVSKVDGQIHDMTYNPADMVEPKFKVGDWVASNSCTGHILHIIDIDSRDYEIETPQGNTGVPTIGYINNNFHLWTIEDAKDGDVLCTYECDEPKIVFILKGTPKKHYALGYHCYYNIMYPHFGSNFEKGCLSPNDEDVKPATKEQRDLLFQKMKEAGFEWDSEKKGLKKISQRMVSAEAKEALYDKPINQ